MIFKKVTTCFNLKDLYLITIIVFLYFCYFKVVRIPETTDETFDALFQFSKELGKVPVSCKVSSVHKNIFFAPLP